MKVGIEAINAYAGQTFLDVNKLAQHRGLDNDRFVNLLMKNKSVAMHFEDPVSFGVNAAKPIIDALTPEEKNKIELLIVSSESGIDFGKGMNSYIHHYLGLKKNCRMFEAKMACYGGTACLQMAINFVASNVSPGAKALVISTDAARPAPMSYAEPSQGAAGLAVLVSDNPKVLKMDFGANGYWGYEVMDTCRPTPDIETGDPDLSLLSYLDCIENAFKCYQERVPGADFQSSFDYLAFHTPFGGMVKGAHRTMMRKLKRLPPPEIEADFQKRMLPALKYCQEVGNVYSATVFLAVCGLIDAADFSTGDKKIGLFSYGSGCCSEFYSGVANAQSQSELQKMKIAQRLAGRYELTMPEYEKVIELNREMMFGLQNKVLDFKALSNVYDSHYRGKNVLVLNEIKNYHREYIWA